ncbi:hypothetical protein K470DRAFT_265844 [Piedraia hortae CBS 480.64]|uniref:Uncharacterized protein n=1 Tax=Piedraia hortae CBS 480.64 TaxID=1314780 RepID=A0A6A7BVH2_9PEZI|nr:hypothetical protein K470DRAFT_265844 [Piedraia hortae CBS 480.64]
MAFCHSRCHTLCASSASRIGSALSTYPQIISGSIARCSAFSPECQHNGLKKLDAFGKVAAEGPDQVSIYVVAATPVQHSGHCTISAMLGLGNKKFIGNCLVDLGAKHGVYMDSAQVAEFVDLIDFSGTRSKTVTHTLRPALTIMDHHDPAVTCLIIPLQRLGLIIDYDKPLGMSGRSNP